MDPVASPRVALDLSPACGTWTGVGRYVIDLARALHESGSDGLGFWHGRSAPAGVLDQWCTSRTRHPGGVIGRRWRLPAALQAAGVDVFHATTLDEPPGPAWTGAVVATVHDCWPLDPESGASAGARRAFRARLARLGARAALIICPSRHTAGELAAAGFAGAVRVVPHGLAPLPMLPPRPLEAPLDPYLVSIGALEPRRNLPLIADALRRLGAQAPPWVHIGPLRDDADGRIRAALADAGCRWLGWRDRHDCLAWLAYAHALAQPSRHEGFGYPPLDAMQLGVPVLALRAAALPEVLDDAALWLDGSGPQAWSDAIARLWRDDALRGQLASAGKRRASRFTLAAMAAGHRAAYDEALIGSPR
ncbi:MAG TPA: glycosyltransferase family 1 protein [Planctomycetota bacterium]|nr:glycosyltransferase family 1 protein [Planctomycetota bacterium]